LYYSHLLKLLLLEKAKKNIMRILRDNAIAVCVDIQEKLFALMHNNMSLEQKSITLISGLKVLDVPLLVTEQYPKGLGATINPLAILIDGNRIEKRTFSCCDEASFDEELKTSGKKQVILFGIESHVCVLQTTIDLLEKGYQVFVVVDCVSSRSEEDKDIALRRLEQEGALLTTTESILFELCRSSKDESFKAISALVK
jgi:hypothetical protein